MKNKNFKKNPIKDNYLLEQYKFALNMLSIMMPICAIVSIVFSVIICSKTHSWIGLLEGLFGIAIIILFILIRKHILKKIKELEEENKGEENETEN